MTARSNHRGFTLLEIIIVIAMLGVLGAIALPTMSRWAPNQRLKGAARDVVSALSQAKAEAVRRGDRVTVLFNYRNEALAEGRKQLYVMFMDTGVGDDRTGRRNAAWDQQGGEKEIIILQSGPLPGRIFMDPVNSTCASGIGAPSYRGVGINTRAMVVDAWDANDNKLMPSDCAIRLCVGDDEEHLGKSCREVTITPAGRVRTAPVK